MALTSTISLRLPKEARERLARAAARARRSRSYIIQRALELHLDEVAREEAPPARPGRYGRLLAMEGAGIGSGGPRTKEEIDDYIRWLRDDDRISG